MSFGNRKQIYCSYSIREPFVSADVEKSVSSLKDSQGNRGCCCFALVYFRRKKVKIKRSILVTWKLQQHSDIFTFLNKCFNLDPILWMRATENFRKLCQESCLSFIKAEMPFMSQVASPFQISSITVHSFTYFYISENSPATCSSVSPYSDCSEDKQKQKR